MAIKAGQDVQTVNDNPNTEELNIVQVGGGMAHRVFGCKNKIQTNH